MTDAMLTPRAVADRLGLAKTNGVLSLIHSGQLAAVNVSASFGRPTWRISEADLDSFLERRRAVPIPAPDRRRTRRRMDCVTRYF